MDFGTIVNVALAKWPERAKDKPPMTIIAPIMEAIHGNLVLCLRRLADSSGGVMGMRCTAIGLSVFFSWTFSLTASFGDAFGV